MYEKQQTEISKKAASLGFAFYERLTSENELCLAFVDLKTEEREELGTWDRHSYGYEFARVYANETLPYVARERNAYSRKQARK